MDKQIKALLMVVGVAVGLLWLAKPKNNLLSQTKLKNKFSAPDKADTKKAEEQHDAGVCLKAMRDAINGGESKSNLDKLNSMFRKEYGLKVYTLDNGSLCVRNREGKTILKES